jgi:hypothetical protein
VGGSLTPLGTFDYPPLDPAAVKIQPEGLTVEQSWLLDLYTLFHARDYRAFRFVLPDGNGEEHVGTCSYLWSCPHPTIVAFEILTGQDAPKAWPGAGGSRLRGCPARPARASISTTSRIRTWCARRFARA